MSSFPPFDTFMSWTRGASGAARLATILDQEMLENRGVTIAARLISDDDLTEKDGVEVFSEIGGRFLIRYLLPESVAGAVKGSATPTFVTCTPYTPYDAIEMLMLPAENRPRNHVMLLDPRKISRILGPRWVRGGLGIEYLLPEGYPRTAVAIRPWSFRTA